MLIIVFLSAYSTLAFFAKGSLTEFLINKLALLQLLILRDIRDRAKDSNLDRLMQILLKRF